MNKAVKWIGIIGGGLTVLCCGIGLALPSGWEVHTSVVIDAPPEAIYPYISSGRRFVEMTEAYSTSQPDLAGSTFEYEFGGPESGKGAWWVSKTETNGRASKVKITITDADPAKGIWYEGAIEQDEVNDHGSITFHAVDGGTEVKWDDKGEMPPVLGGYMGLIISPMLEGFFHGTLLEIKKRVEAEPGASTPETPETPETPDEGG